MASTFKTKSFQLTGEHQHILKDVGAIRKAGSGQPQGMSIAAPSRDSGGMTLRDDRDCPVSVVPDDIECFGLDGVQDIVDNRNATYLNMASFAETIEDEYLTEEMITALGDASFGSIYTGSDSSGWGLMDLATRGGHQPYAQYVLARLDYTSPCQLNGALVELQYPGAEIIAFFGTIKDTAGVQQTGAAHEHLWAISKKAGTPALGQGISFIPASAGERIPAASTLTKLCWVLLGVGEPSYSQGQGGPNDAGNDNQYGGSHMYGGGTSDLPCPEEFPIIVHGAVKPEWRNGHLGLIGTDLWAAHEAWNGPSSGWSSAVWFIIMSQLLFGSLEVVSHPYVSIDPEVARWWDVNSDRAVGIADVVAFVNWMQQIVVDRDIPSSLSITYPRDCCDDEERTPDVPDKEEKEDPPVPCEAHMEILAVKCVPSNSGIAGGHGQGLAHGKGREDFIMRTFGSDNRHSLNVAVSGDDCDEIEHATEEGQSNDMYIYVGLRHDLPVSGFQFDVGFNKYSSAPLANCGAMIPGGEMSAKNWNMVSKAFDDRFGYDRVIRVVSWQPLYDFSQAQKNKGFNIQDGDFLMGLQTFPSLDPAISDFRGVALVHVRNAPPTSCACPEKKFYIDGDLSSIRQKNPDQLKNPSRYTEGKEWHGPVAYHAGRYWTASQDAGPLVRDASSLPLSVVWDGIELLNKRVVTNYRTRPTYHDNYGLKYMGDFLGLYASVPAIFDDFESFFTSADGIGPWVLKTLHNGMNTKFPQGCAEYEYLWDELFNRYILSLEASSGSSLGATAKNTLKADFDKGFADDATLDGKFDVADLVALHNSAQIRMLFPDPLKAGQAGATKDTWKNPPTDWSVAGREGDSEAFKKWKEAQKDKKDGAAGTQSDGRDFYAWTTDEEQKGAITRKSQLPNLERIVPTYCLNTFNTATMPDHCPAIVGGVYAETKDTLRSSIVAGGQSCGGRFQLQYLSQRTDIMPDKAATAKFVFAKKPDADATMQIQDITGRKEKIRFSASATGTDLDGGYKAIQIKSDLNATMTEVNTFFSSHSDTNITCALTPSSGNKTGFILTQAGIGSKGNTSIKTTARLNLIQYQSRFKDGSSYMTTLPNAFRDWAQYFKSEHSIANIDLYQNEEEYGTSGASFFEVRTAVNCEGYNTIMTPIIGYVSKSVATLNFCGGYDADTAVKAKILPGDGFKMVDVYDAETGALLTAATTALHKNFYSIPNHGKIRIVSHNFLTASMDAKIAEATLKNSKHFTPITQDGGSLVTAKVFVTPKPDYSAGKYLELLCGDNPVLGTGNLELWSGNTKPIGYLRQEATSKGSAVGPATSQFSQNYVDDSSSLHTYSDYMLHAEVITPQHVRIKYNTMKPFKYATFSVRTHTGAEIDSVKLLQNSALGDGKLYGWKVDHTFHEDTTDVYGFPLEPGQYSGDGYSQVSVYITGSYTDESGATQTGFANPPEYNGMGDLCDIYFKTPLFEEFPLKGKKYICPPIGGQVFDSYPEKPRTSHTEDTQNGVEKDYPEGSREEEKYFQDDGVNPLIANFDAEDSFATQVEVVEVGGADKVSTWISTPGVTSIPHNANTAHRPDYNVNSNDTRKSVVFGGGQGLSTASSGVGFRSHDIHKWSAYILVDMAATLNSGMSNTNEATIFKVGGNGTSQFSLELKVRKESASGAFKLQAVSKANDASNNGQTTTLEHDIAVASSNSPLHGWHIISWVGDAEEGKAWLYIDGTEVATSAITHSNGLGAHGIVWNIGHDGSNTSINGTIGNAAGKPFGGRIAQLMLYKEAHDTEMREKVETYFAVKNPNEGTTEIQGNLPGGHTGNKDVVGGQTEEGIDIEGYKNLNKTDKTNKKRKENAMAKEREGGERQFDLGSDRCAAQWVSEHVCLDKSAQTLLNVSCEGTGEGFQLGD
tara:strand:+ start:58 stop:5757 length:5700 start_codon:yes stop_codon:yes gene_type:complete